MQSSYSELMSYHHRIDKKSINENRKQKEMEFLTSFKHIFHFHKLELIKRSGEMGGGGGGG